MKERNQALDILKGFAIILVVIGHIGSDWPWLIKWIYSFHIPLFFSISGFIEASKYDSNKDIGIKRYIIHKSKSMLWTYMIWAAIYSVANALVCINSGDWNLLFRTLFSRGFGIVIADNAIGTIWFLLVLYETEVVSFVLKKLENGWITFFIILVGLILYMIGTRVVLPYLLQLLWIGLLFYQFGDLLCRYQVIHRILEWTKSKFRYTISRYGIWGVMFSLFSIVSLYNDKIDIINSEFGNAPLTIVSACGEILCCFVLCTLASNIKAMRPVKALGQETLIIMTTHFYINEICYVVLRQFGLSDWIKGSLVAMILWSIIITVMCYGLSLFIRKYLPFLVRFPFVTKKG